MKQFWITLGSVISVFDVGVFTIMNYVTKSDGIIWTCVCIAGGLMTLVFLIGLKTVAGWIF